MAKFTISLNGVRIEAVSGVYVGTKDDFDQDLADVGLPAFAPLPDGVASIMFDDQTGKCFAVTADGDQTAHEPLAEIGAILSKLPDLILARSARENPPRPAPLTKSERFDLNIQNDNTLRVLIEEIADVRGEDVNVTIQRIKGRL